MGVDYVAASNEYHEQGSSVIADNNVDLPYSIAIWFNPTSHTATNSNLWGVARADGLEIIAFYYSDATVAYFHYGYISKTTSTFSDGTWSLLVGVSKAQNDRYVVLNADWAGRGTSINQTVPTSLVATSFGSHPVNYTDPADAVMAHVMLWKGHALTQSDIDALYKGANPYTIGRGSLSNYWPMHGDGPVGTRLRDQVGGFHISTTIGGTPAKSEQSKPTVRNCFMQGGG